MSTRLKATILLALGLLRMTGDTFDAPWLFGIGALSAASPAPRVFTTVGTMEPFSTRLLPRVGRGPR